MMSSIGSMPCDEQLDSSVLGVGVLPPFARLNLTSNSTDILLFVCGFVCDDAVRLSIGRGAFVIDLFPFVAMIATIQVCVNTRQRLDGMEIV